MSKNELLRLAVLDPEHAKHLIKPDKVKLRLENDGRVTLILPSTAVTLSTGEWELLGEHIRDVQSYICEHRKESERLRPVNIVVNPVVSCTQMVVRQQWGER